MIPFRNVLVAIAVGDAFGSGIENLCRTWIMNNVDFTRYVDAKVGMCKIGYRAGDYSDDTSDTIAVIKTLMSGQKFNVDNLLSNIKIEWEESKTARDGVPRAGFGSITRYLSGECDIDVIRNLQKNRQYPGNAPPMRSIPIGFLNNDDLIDKYSKVNSDVTHPHPKGVCSAILIAQAAQFMLGDELNQSDIISHVNSFILGIDEETSNYINFVDTVDRGLFDVIDTDMAHLHPDYARVVGNQPYESFMTKEMVIGLNSDAMRTAGLALYIVKFSRSTYEGLRKAILDGGDVDSLAAIVCGLLSIRYDITDLPKFMIDGLENVNYLQEIGDQFDAYRNRVA